MEARELGHNYIGTEHLLLGLLREEEGLAARVLESLGIALDQVRDAVVTIAGRGEDALATGQIPFTPRAKKVLELALREGLSMGHNYVGTEHLLLGLVRENGGVAARILLGLGIDASLVRETTLDLLSGPRTEAAAKWQQRLEQLESIPVMSVRTFADKPSARTVPLIAGAAIFAIALAIGLLLGYLIWH